MHYNRYKQLEIWSITSYQAKKKFLKFKLKEYSNKYMYACILNQTKLAYQITRKKYGYFFQMSSSSSQVDYPRNYACHETKINNIILISRLSFSNRQLPKVDSHSSHQISSPLQINPPLCLCILDISLIVTHGIPYVQIPSLLKVIVCI